jgi:hypothetical protein
LSHTDVAVAEPLYAARLVASPLEALVSLLHGHVFAATGVTGPPAAVAGGEGGIETEARHQHCQQRQPKKGGK